MNEPSNSDQHHRSVLGGVVRHLTASNHRRRDNGPLVYGFLKLRQPERARHFKSIALQLAFDSLLEPAPAGCRSDAPADRHLVFLSSEYALDIQLEQPQAGRSVVHGELLSRRDGPLAEIPTFLLEGGCISAYACTGSLGEFSFEGEPGTETRLCMLLDFDHCIDLALDLQTTVGASVPA